MGTKLIKNIDDEVWRQFTGFCKMQNILVGKELTKILKKYLGEKKI